MTNLKRPVVPAHCMRSQQLKSLIEFAAVKKVFHFNDCYRFYMTDARIKNALKFLISNGVLKELKSGYYEYIWQKNNEEGSDDK